MDFEEIHDPEKLCFSLVVVSLEYLSEKGFISVAGMGAEDLRI